MTHSTAKALDVAQDIKTFCTYNMACVRLLPCPWHLIPTNYILTTAEDPFIHKLGPRCIKNWDAVLFPVAFAMVRNSTLNVVIFITFCYKIKKTHVAYFRQKKKIPLLWKVFPQRDRPQKLSLWSMSPPWIIKSGMIWWKIVFWYLNLSTPTARRWKCFAASGAISLNNSTTNLPNTEGWMIGGWMTDTSSWEFWGRTMGQLWNFHSHRLNTFTRNLRNTDEQQEGSAKLDRGETTRDNGKRWYGHSFILSLKQEIIITIRDRATQRAIL